MARPTPAANRAGGLGDLTVARDSGTIVFTAPTLPGAAEADAERLAKRKDAGVSAILHESYPIRQWDHELGPAEPRLFVLDEGEARDLTPDAGTALVGQTAAVTPDGTTVITGWWEPTGRGDKRSELVAIDVASGERRTSVGEAGADFQGPVISPDGRFVVCQRETHGNTDEPLDDTFWLVPLDPLNRGAAGELATGLDLWPGGPAWSPDNRRPSYFHADQRGRRPIFALDLGSGEVAGSPTTTPPTPSSRRHRTAATSTPCVGIDAEPVAVRINLKTSPEC